MCSKVELFTDFSINKQFMEVYKMEKSFLNKCK